MPASHQTPHSAYAIFINTVCEGSIPAWHNEKGFPVTYATEREAKLEIVDDLQERLRQFIAGERDFEEAIAIEDFILSVDAWPDGSISLQNGSVFGKRE